MNYNILAAHVRGLEAAASEAVTELQQQAKQVQGRDGVRLVYSLKQAKAVLYITCAYANELKHLRQTFDNINAI